MRSLLLSFLGLVLACSATQEDITLQNPLEAGELDDAAPSAPVYDEALDFELDGTTYNHSAERFRFDVGAYASEADRIAYAKLYPSHAAFLAANVAALPSVQSITSAIKQLDDSVYAGVELALQHGLGAALAPKTRILSGAIEWLGAHRSADGDAALVTLAAALTLGGESPAAPADLADRVESTRTLFLARADVAKPIGFYTWSDDLQRVWQQDRLLQDPFETNGPACALAQAVTADPVRESEYRRLVDAYARLTNPLHSSLVDLLPMVADSTCAAQTPHAFLSRSRTVEVELYERLYPNGIPDGANLMQDLVDAIRAGTVDLAPKADQGFYQWQEYALETLLVTDRSERTKIGFTAQYKKRLQEAFESILVQHRETHVKQNDEYARVSADVSDPTPTFRSEPLATVYVRHARSYVFLEAALERTFGAALLDGAVAVDASGATQETLRARLQRERNLLFGLYLVSCQDLGLHPQLDQVGDPDLSQTAALAAAASTWLAGIARDPLMAADVRVMIPIAETAPGRKRYWAVVGVRATLAAYSYITNDSMQVPSPSDQTRVALSTEQFIEVESSATPLTRDEFRTLCDQNESVERIQHALEAR